MQYKLSTNKMQQLNKVLHYLLILQVVVQQPYQLS
ncbi:Uncharacterised protein [Mycobacteroides abscessus subsp. abscessus]|nr:Uncharacterised protein [Mycobacteroides abscessus subsp. abscessus]